MRLTLQSILFTVVVALASCRGGNNVSLSTADGDTLALKHSSLLTIVEHDGYTVAEISNPWKPGKLLHRYYLVPRTSDVNLQTSDLTDGTIVEVPVQRAAVFTTVHCALLTELGLGSHIVGVADAKYIKVPYIQEQIKAGRIVDCGNGLNPVVEKIMDVKPDVIMLSPFENSGGYGKTEEIGIPLIECAEYMETSPLARAEWMRFYGLLFGESAKADRLFQQVDSSYTALKEQAAKAGEGRSVLVDKITGSVWYMPGGRSTIGQMLQDAGGRYLWATDNQSGSLSLPFETVLERGGESDVWILRYSSDHDLNYNELLSDYHGYSQLKAFRHREVYGCNVELSYFYEDTPFHPDRLLCDFLQILHPDIIGLPPLRYYKKLKK
ncbi:MAG: ABC transporter substrate-binding protein [Prevotella sp.]|nr:ABC transporter substrate-binding protein [Prevotella sp.]